MVPPFVFFTLESVFLSELCLRAGALPLEHRLQVLLVAVEVLSEDWSLRGNPVVSEGQVGPGHALQGDLLLLQNSLGFQVNNLELVNSQGEVLLIQLSLVLSQGDLEEVSFVGGHGVSLDVDSLNPIVLSLDERYLRQIVSVDVRVVLITGRFLAVNILDAGSADVPR